MYSVKVLQVHLHAVEILGIGTRVEKLCQILHILNLHTYALRLLSTEKKKVKK